MSGEELNSFVYDYDDLLAGPFASFLSQSKAIGGHAQTISEMVDVAVRAQRHFLTVASQAKPPTQDVLAALLKPTSDHIQSIQSYREKNRTSEYFNHLSAISESIPALGWVAVSPTPGPYVKEMKDASQFYTNKILVAFKDKDKSHVNWAKSWVEFLTELQAYVKKSHTTGLVWKVRGGVDAATFVGGAVRGGAGPGGPPPPPPPPPADLFAAEPAKAGGDDSRNALLKELNRGTDITRGLKKVTADQQTHKNPALKSQGIVSASAVKTAGSNGYGKEQAPKPPRFELEGKKWMVEFMVGRKDIVIADAEMNQSVNLYKCKDVLVQIKGKVNSVFVDSCSKTAVVFENIVACIEFVNCQNVQAQSMGKVPTINIEKTDVAQIFLCKESMDAEIVTAKCSAVNVSVPNAQLDDYVEYPIPEQFKSIFTGKGFRTEPADKAS